MGKIVRHFATDFTSGSISCILTFEGENAEDVPEVLDSVHAVVSKQAHKSLIPQLNRLTKEVAADLSGQEFKVEETVVLELLDHTFTVDIVLELEEEPKSPNKEMLGFLVVNAIASTVIADAAERFSRRFSLEVQQDYYEEHPEDAPDLPFRMVDLGTLLAGGFN